MTAVDEDAFIACFEKLARAQGGPTDGLTMSAYFDALQELPLAAIQGAADNLARTGGAWFPKAAQWYEAALAVQRATITPAYVPPGGREEPWQNECEDCRDTGWIERWVEKGELRFSKLQKREIPAMYRHQVAMKCPCRETNRTYQRLHVHGADESTPISHDDAKRLTKRAKDWQPS